MSVFPTTKILPPGDILGREAFMRDVVRRVLEHQSVMIPGPRRIGKTAVATEILRRCRDDAGAITASLDVFLQSTAEDLATALITSLLSVEEPSLRMRMRDSLQSLSKVLQQSELVVQMFHAVEWRWLFHLDQTSESELLDHALTLPQTLATQRGRPVVVLFDEFQDVMSIGGIALMKRMRALWQRQPDTAYLFLGSQGGMMRTLFGQTHQALYRFADVLELPPIAPETWTPYLQRKFAAHGLTIERAIAQRLGEQTGGHPFDTMKLCQAAYDIARDRGSRTIDPQVAWLAYNRTHTELAAIFASELRGLDAIPHARQILLRIARDQSVYPPGLNAGQAKRAIDGLLTEGWIRRVRRGHYQFEEAMFRDFLLEQEL